MFLLLVSALNGCSSFIDEENSGSSTECIKVNYSEDSFTETEDTTILLKRAFDKKAESLCCQYLGLFLNAAKVDEGIFITTSPFFELVDIKRAVDIVKEATLKDKSFNEKVNKIIDFKKNELIKASTTKKFMSSPIDESINYFSEYLEVFLMNKSLSIFLQLLKDKEIVGDDKNKVRQCAKEYLKEIKLLNSLEEDLLERIIRNNKTNYKKAIESSIKLYLSISEITNSKNKERLIIFEDMSKLISKLIFIEESYKYNEFIKNLTHTLEDKGKKPSLISIRKEINDGLISVKKELLNKEVTEDEIKDTIFTTKSYIIAKFLI